MSVRLKSSIALAPACMSIGLSAISPEAEPKA